MAEKGTTVYRWERPDGTFEFSDEPRSGSETIVVEEPMIQPSRGLELRSRPVFSTQFSYSRLVITEPIAGVTLRNQQADAVLVSGEFEPGLRKGHRVFLLVDGETSGAGSRSASFQTSRLERGAHTLQLEIRDGDGEAVIKSEAVTVNVQRTTVPAAHGGAS